MAAKITIDPVNKLIIVKDGVTELNVGVDLYSDMKEDWLADPELQKYEFPWRPLGGDPLGSGKFVGSKYFLKTGWRIRPYEAAHGLLVEGDLYSNEDPPEALFVPTLGGYTVGIVLQRAVESIAIQAESSAAELVWSALDGSYVPGTMGYLQNKTASKEEIADQVYDEQTDEHDNSGSFGSLFQQIVDSAIDYDEVANAVWNALKSGHLQVGTMGEWVQIVERLLANEVTKDGNIITIYREDKLTPWRQYDLANGGRRIL